MRSKPGLILIAKRDRGAISASMEPISGPFLPRRNETGKSPLTGEENHKPEPTRSLQRTGIRNRCDLWSTHLPLSS